MGWISNEQIKDSVAELEELAKYQGTESRLPGWVQNRIEIIRALKLEDTMKQFTEHRAHPMYVLETYENAALGKVASRSGLVAGLCAFAPFAIVVLASALYKQAPGFWFWLLFAAMGGLFFGWGWRIRAHPKSSSIQTSTIEGRREFRGGTAFDGVFFMVVSLCPFAVVVMGAIFMLDW